jgi:hypothetical protein
MFSFPRSSVCETFFPVVRMLCALREQVSIHSGRRAPMALSVSSSNLINCSGRVLHGSQHAPASTSVGKRLRSERSALAMLRIWLLMPALSVLTKG